MKKSKKILALLLAVLMVAAIVPMTAFAATSGDWEYDDLYVGIVVTKYNGSAKDVTVPSVLDGKTVVEVDGVFDNCTFLKTVTIPDSVKRIGNSTFRNCTSLETVNIGSDFKYLGNYVTFDPFEGCSSLRNINISPENEEFYSIDGVAYKTFDDGYELLYRYPAGRTEKSFTIPNNIQTIDSNAFRDCTALENVIIPDSVLEINMHAFSGCTSLKSITIPESVESIEYFAMGFDSDCKKLDNNFTIYGVKGTEAEKYANHHGFKFIEIGATEPEKPGDISGDGVVSANDAVMIQRYVAGFEKLNADQIKVADLNKDGIVDEGDAVVILRIDAGLAS